VQDTRSNEKVKIKVSPATLMTEVLADYCKQKGMEVERATLLHKGKPVDLSTPFRLSGLSNNATLTVGQRASTAVPVLTIALQLDSTRVQAKFQVSNTLWQVLLGFEALDGQLNLTRLMQAQPPSGERTGFLHLSAAKPGPVGWMQPVVTLLNKQFSSIEDLSATTLQSLGLTSGSCLLRVSHQWTPRDSVPTTNVTPAVPVTAATPSPPASAPSAPVASVAGGGNNNNAPAPVEVEFAKPEPVAPRPAKAQKTEEEEAVAAAPVVDATVPENRNFVVFQPSDVPFNPSSFEVPDDFYNLAPSDLAAAKGGNKEAVLMTREFREKKQMAAYAKFVKTNIRVRFPDRWELQGTFLSHEGTMQLVEFVRRFVAEDREFVLYTTPPKQNLENATFLAQKLMPAAVVYFIWEDRGENEGYLTDEAKKSAVVFGKGVVHLSTFSSQTPVDYTVEGGGNGSEAGSGGGNGKGKEEAHQEKKKKPGVPSWLRLKK
jgi:hypothetical protein